LIIVTNREIVVKVFNESCNTVFFTIFNQLKKYKHFIDTIRSNSPSMLNAKIEEGVNSTTVMHLGNIAYQLGRLLEFDPRLLNLKMMTKQTI